MWEMSGVGDRARSQKGSTPEVDPPRLGANDETVLGVGGMGALEAIRKLDGLVTSMGS